MLESKFVKQNKEKWSELETILSTPSGDPEKLSELFVQVSEDLSYARTHYPNRSVRLYLNQLTQRIFSTLYKNRKNRWKQLRDFWKYELPVTMYLARKELLLSVVIFLSAMLIGAFSCKNDPSFASWTMGDEYVNMTLENIQKGDPMAVYKQRQHTDMFLSITINNIRVALITFVLGLFLGLGTAGFILSNGIMVGTFQYFFYQHGLLAESFVTIWLHGALEISSIVLAGAAGFCLGKGLVFPGSYSRFQSFQTGARKGIKIMLGIIPLFVLAGFIEGFLTRYTEVPALIRFAFIILSFGFILFYYVIYPARVFHHPLASPFKIDEIPEPLSTDFVGAQTIKSSGEIFSSTLARLFSLQKVILPAILILSALFSIWWVLWVKEGNPGIYNFSGYETLNNLLQYLDMKKFKWMAFVPLVLSISAVETLILQLGPKGLSGNFRTAILSKYFIENLITVSILVSTLFIGNTTGFIVFYLLLPLKIFWSATHRFQDSNLFTSFWTSLRLLGESVRMALGQYLIMTIMILILSILGTSPIIWIYFEVLTWNITESSVIQYASSIFVSFLTIFILLFSYALLCINSMFLYENLYEIRTGSKLRQLIDNFKVRKGYV